MGKACQPSGRISNGQSLCGVWEEPHQSLDQVVCDVALKLLCRLLRSLKLLNKTLSLGWDNYVPTTWNDHFTQRQTVRAEFLDIMHESNWIELEHYGLLLKSMKEEQRCLSLITKLWLLWNMQLMTISWRQYQNETACIEVRGLTWSKRKPSCQT